MNTDLIGLFELGITLAALVAGQSVHPQLERQRAVPVLQAAAPAAPRIPRPVRMRKAEPAQRLALNLDP